MKVLVCGGRDWRDKGAVWRVLAQLQPSVIIEGGCRGPDTMAFQYGRDNCIPVETHCANWKQFGRRAGPIRNQEMIDKGKPDLVVACPGGRGTADMVSRAKAAGIRVIEPCSATTPSEKHCAWCDGDGRCNGV